MAKAQTHGSLLKVGHLPSTADSGTAFLVYPEWAEWALQTFNTHNRRRSVNVVDRYAREIKEDTWRLTHQGIAFSREPVFLIDGQHRLAAVVQADKPAWFLIFLNQDPENQLVVDDHTVRRTADAFTLTGLPVSQTEVAIANAMMLGPTSHTSGSKPTKTTLRSFISEHMDAIRLVVGMGLKKCKGVTSASCLAVVARAYYHTDRETLTRFMKILVSGIPENGDEAAATVITLRNWLLNRSSSGLGSAGKIEVYRKVQKMLKSYIDGDSVLKATASEKDLFPLPQTTEN